MRIKILIVITSLLILNGCAGIPVRTHPQFLGYFQGEEKAITVMPIDIKFYKLTAGGVPEQMDEWDVQSDTLFKKAIMDKLDPSLRFKIKILEDSDLDPKFKDFLDEQNGLYRAIAGSIIFHTYMPGSIFPNKLKNFDYTLGSALSRINDFYPSDTLLFFSGTRTFWTGGRVLLATWGMLLGAATGVVVVPGSAPDWVAVSLVDAKTGNIIWFRYIGAPFSTVGDLRNEEAVSDTIDYLFRDLVR
jgi:hypothetical protein